MSIETDTRDRVIRLEAEVEALGEKVSAMDVKVTAMHELLLQAKGARWLLIAAAGLGGFISAKLAPFLPWLGGK
jgi:hypothetical protein